MLLLFFIFILFLDTLFCSEKPFVLVIPSYNNAHWYVRTLDSIFAQQYQNYRVIYIDDASTDGTGSLVQSYIQKRDLVNKVTFIQNTEHKGSLANKYKGIWLCDPEEIVIDLDGDDWLYHDHVLSYLNSVYQNKDIWVTYGQFIHYPFEFPGWAAEVPGEIIRDNAFREYTWVTTALRTFYAGLFQKIKRSDLLIDGAFFPMAGDLAFMFPIIEMAGVHSQFISDVLYVYNVLTPMNDMKLDRQTQMRLDLVIRDRAKYSAVTSPY